MAILILSRQIFTVQDKDRQISSLLWSYNIQHKILNSRLIRIFYVTISPVYANTNHVNNKLKHIPILAIHTDSVDTDRYRRYCYVITESFIRFDA